MMLQKEVGGGGRLDPGEGLQRPGYLIRDFALPSVVGGQVRISDYHGWSNLVLVFAGQHNTEFDFLREAAKRALDFKEEEAVVIAAFQNASQATHCLQEGTPSSFSILVDSDGMVHRAYGAADEHRMPSPVIYLTDRFGEIAAVWGSKNMPSVDEILSMLEFVNHRCPECEPPEWPR